MLIDNNIMTTLLMRNNNARMKRTVQNSAPNIITLKKNTEEKFGYIRSKIEQEQKMTAKLGEITSEKNFKQGNLDIYYEGVSNINSVTDTLKEMRNAARKISQGKFDENETADTVAAKYKELQEELITKIKEDKIGVALIKVMSPQITEPQYYEDMDIANINKAIDIVDNYIPRDDIAKLEGEVAALTEKEKEQTMRIKAQRNAVYTVNSNQSSQISYKDIEEQKKILGAQLKTAQETAKETDETATTFAKLRELADKITNGDYADEKERDEIKEEYALVKEKFLTTTLKNAMGDEFDEMFADKTLDDIIKKGDDDLLKIADILAETDAKDILTMNIDDDETAAETSKQLADITKDFADRQKEESKNIDEIKQQMLNLEYIFEEMKIMERSADTPSKKEILTNEISKSKFINIAV